MTIITGNKTDEDLVREYFKKQQENPSKPQLKRKKKVSKVPSIDNVLVLDDITCVDANDVVFEHYEKVLVSKDIFRERGNIKSLNPYDWIVHCENNSLTLPSTALSCNILAKLFQLAVSKQDEGTFSVIDPLAKKILDMYKDKGDGYGYHAQNTVINYGSSNVVHYPSHSDFSNNSGKTNINQTRKKIELGFDKVKPAGILRKNNILTNVTLEEGLKDKLTTHFVKQYTGLENPSVLIDIAKYYGRTARIWFPSDVNNCTDVRTAWLGCNNNYFNLNAYSNLGDTCAARGVKFLP